MAEAAAEDHREPIRRAQPARDAGPARRRPRPSVRRAPRSRSSRARGAACSALASPALGALARAYVHDDIDFTGSARRMLGVVDAMVGDDLARARPRCAARWRILAAPAAQQPRQHPPPLRRLQRVLPAVARCADGLLVRVFPRRRATRSTRRRPQKLDHICRKLRLQPGERFLDIGCGWGALLFRAAEQYGVEATGITLSRNQFDHVTRGDRGARARRARARRAAATTSTCRRTSCTTRSRAWACSSTWAFARFPKYFGKICRILKPGGLVLNHGITHNPLGAQSLGSGIGDFVEEYVFPGGELTHVARVIEGMAAQGLEVDRCRGAARALREDAVALVRAPRGQRRRRARPRSARRSTASGGSTSRGRRMRSTAAGCRCGSCSRARPLADGRLPHPLTREYMYAG